MLQFATLVLLGLAAPPPSPPPSTRAPDRAAILQAARDVMAKARFCTMVTLAEDGRPQARVVDPFAPEDDLAIWIATRPATRKVAQVRRDPRVTLLYFDGVSAYVTVDGRAELVSDPAEKAKRWKDDWASFYEDGNRGGDYQLIRVRPSHLEVSSQAHGMTNDPVTWRPPGVDLGPAGR